jgi:hypothetical protein
VALLSVWTMRQMLLCVNLVNKKLNRKNQRQQPHSDDHVGHAGHEAPNGNGNLIWYGPIGFREVAANTFPTWGTLIVDITLMSCQV